MKRGMTLRKMGAKGLACLLLAAALTLAGCAGESNGVYARYAPEEDRRLVVYTSHKEEVYRPIIKEFEERTGVWVELVTGGTNELLDRLVQEREHPQADVMFGGGVDSLEAYRDCFTPYFCKDWELLEADMRSPIGLWTPFSALPVVLVYNTKLVAPGQLTGWKDLFSPAWQGRIAFCDPGVSGSSFTGLVTMLYALGGDMDEKLVDFAVSLDGRQLESSGQVLDSVAEGTDLIGITLEETALKRVQEGEELGIVYPSEGTSCVPDGGALVKGAAHEENAQLFLDFIAGVDVQRRMESEYSRRPIRMIQGQAPALTPLEDIPLVDYDIEWVVENRNQLLMSWAFYFGGGEEP